MGNGSGVYVAGIVVTALGSLAAFIGIEVLRPGLDNALLYGQVFLFAGSITAGLFNAMKTAENKSAIVETNRVGALTAASVVAVDKKVDVVHDKVDGLNAAALFNQDKLSQREGFDKGIAASAQVAAAAMGASLPAAVTSGAPGAPLLTQEVQPGDPRYVPPSPGAAGLKAGPPVEEKPTARFDPPKRG